MIDRQVRRTLVDSLYSNPLSLVIGAVCGSLVCLSAAYVARDATMMTVAWGVAVIALFRTVMMVAVRHSSQAKTRTLELLFEVGAFAYAGAVSVLTTLAILHDVMLEVQMVLMVVSVSYATAIAARNAGRPAIALGQLLLVLAPLSLVLLFSDMLLIQILGLATLLHIPSTISITVNVYRSLRNSIAAAETSARLAQRMQVLARTDVVTGLLNRAGLNHHLVERLMLLPPGD